MINIARKILISPPRARGVVIELEKIWWELIFACLSRHILICKTMRNIIGGNEGQVYIYAGNDYFPIML